jgi:hypothetical protein
MQEAETVVGRHPSGLIVCEDPTEERWYHSLPFFGKGSAKKLVLVTELDQGGIMQGWFYIETIDWNASDRVYKGCHFKHPFHAVTWLGHCIEMLKLRKTEGRKDIVVSGYMDGNIHFEWPMWMDGFFSLAPKKGARIEMRLHGQGRAIFHISHDDGSTGVFADIESEKALEWCRDCLFQMMAVMARSR